MSFLLFRSSVWSRAIAGATGSLGLFWGLLGAMNPVNAQTGPIYFGQDQLPAGTATPYYSPPPTAGTLERGVPLPVYQGSTNFNTNPVLGRYVVYVNGDSDLLLNQVRRVESGAFRRSSGNGPGQVIQAGRFLSLNNAESRVLELEQRGILAQVETLAVGGTSQTNDFQSTTYPTTAYPITTPGAVNNPYASNVAPPGFSNSAFASNPYPANTLDFTAPPAYPPSYSGGLTPLDGSAPNADLSKQPSQFYVAIPARAETINVIAGELVAIGINPATVSTRGSRRGPFVALGPYSDRLNAEVTVSNLREYGFSNARVIKQ